ncbi:MAG TPA: glycosyltransferase family 2 protein, partial [Microvirga sp.]|nr:glycosyltransferase family 2 protein [Microvirga sp.]
LGGGGLRVEVVHNASNRGFGAACNQGAARGQAPFLLFLNPDTRVAPETLTRALDHLRAPEQQRTGALGVRLVDEAGRTQRTCAREPTPWRLLAQNAGFDRLFPRLVRPHFLTEWDHEETRPVDQVMGAFLLIRRTLFERLGGFDERFFVYYEDVDLCARVRRAGGEVVHFADAEAWHQGGGTTSQIKGRRLFYMMRSQILYADKWFGRGAALATLLVALGVHVPVRTARGLFSLAPREALAALAGGFLLARDLPALLAGLRGPAAERAARERA